MRTIPTLLAGALILVSSLGHAKIWRVNYDGYDADFTGVDAINDAVVDVDVEDGDTLHIEPSASIYNGSDNFNKRLVVIGPGFLLEDNAGLQANTLSARVYRLIFTDGSEGSFITGITVNGGFGTQIAIAERNITIERCMISAVNFNNVAGGVDDIVITQCFLIGGTGYGFGATPVNGLIISNCYLGNTMSLAPNHQGTVSQCVLANGSNIHGVIFFNNIVRAGTTVQNTNSNTTMYNNIFHDNPGAWLDSGTNFRTQDMTEIFATEPASTDAELVPLGSCEECPNGYGGAEIGMFGGPTPYVLSGIPWVPAIYQLQQPGTAVQGDVVPVTISTRSNN